MTGRQVTKYIRLTELIPELLDLADEKKIALGIAVDISYFDEQVQKWVYEYIKDNGFLKLARDKPVYIIGAIAIIVVSMALQHFVKVFRVIYVLFTGVIASIMGPVFIGYESPAKMYLTMAFCFGVSAIWGFISWRCIIEK